MEGIPQRQPLTTAPDGTVDADEVLAFIDELDPNGTNPKAQQFRKVVEDLKADGPRVKLRENMCLAKFDVPEGQEFPEVGQKPVEVIYSGDDYTDEEGKPCTVVKTGDQIDESESFGGW